MSMAQRNIALPPHERYIELVGIKTMLGEVRQRLKSFALSEAVKHLEITDIALTRALIEIRAELEEMQLRLNDNTPSRSR
jgi:hypothetical protein